MKKLAYLSVGLVGLAALLFAFAPTKASAADYYDSMGNHMYSTHRNYYPNYYQRYNFRNYPYNNYYRTSYNPYMYRYYNNYNNYNIYRTGVTYPRTVYLIDSSNSANQLNIINATAGGTTNAARIYVTPDVYNQIVNDYDASGIISIRVDMANDYVTFHTVNGTVTTYPVMVQFM